MRWRSLAALFSVLDRSGEAEKERKRHDFAVEAHQRAESEYHGVHISTIIKAK